MCLSILEQVIISSFWFEIESIFTYVNYIRIYILFFFLKILFISDQPIAQCQEPSLDLLSPLLLYLLLYSRRLFTTQPNEKKTMKYEPPSKLVRVRLCNKTIYSKQKLICRLFRKTCPHVRARYQLLLHSSGLFKNYVCLPFTTNFNNKT